MHLLWTVFVPWKSQRECRKHIISKKGKRFQFNQVAAVVVRKGIDIMNLSLRKGLAHEEDLCLHQKEVEDLDIHLNLLEIVARVLDYRHVRDVEVHIRPLLVPEVDVFVVAALSIRRVSAQKKI